MQQIRKFLQLAWPDRLLLFQTIVVLAIVTLGLKIFPWMTLQHLLLRRANRRSRFMSAQCPSAQRISWAIQIARRYVPKATCLPQALAAQFLFIQHGYPADLYIGAGRNEHGKFEAHAWVTSESGIIIGKIRDLEHFVPLSLRKEKA